MIQFYANEIGVDLVFPVTGADGQPLTDTPEVGWPKLYVTGSPSSPITLNPVSDTPGSYHHTVAAGEFPLDAPDVIHYFECWIEWHGSGRVILSDAFNIAVIKAPSTSLE